MEKQKKTILVVEDSELLRTTLSKAIEKRGFRVFVAENQEKGRELAFRQLPDMILIDILMPGEDGFLLLQELLSNNDLKGRPVIVITNLADPEWRKKCLDLGAAEYLVKADYRLDQLIEKLEEICKRYCGS